MLRQGTVPSFVISMLLLSMIVAPALGQRKRTPPPYDPDREARADEEALKSRFLYAYENAGWPKIILFTHLNYVEENNVPVTNKRLISRQYHNRFTDYFTHPDVTLIDVDESKKRQLKLDRALSNEELPDVSRLLSDQLDGDIVVLTTIDELIGRRDGAKYSIFYEMSDRNRGEVIASHAWVMYADENAPGGEIDPGTIALHAREAAYDVMDRFIRRFSAGAGGAVRPFTLEFNGLRGREVRPVREVLRGVPGVQARSVRSARVQGRLATLELKYRGDPIDLAIDAANVIEDELQKLVTFERSGEGFIVFTVKDQSLTTDEMRLNGDPDTSENREIRRRLASAYAGEGQPRIGVMINREHDVKSDDEEEDPRDEDDESADSSGDQGGATAGAEGEAGKKGDGITIILQPRTDIRLGPQVNVGGGGEAGGAGTPDRRGAGRGGQVDGQKNTLDMPEDQLLDTLLMESQILQRLSTLGLTCVDLAQAQRLLEEEKKIAGEIHDNRELAQLLGFRADAQIMACGWGQVKRSSGFEGVQITYTMQVIKTEDATFLAGANVATEVARSADIVAATERLAADMTGKLALQMLQKWSPPKTLQVVVSNCRSPRELRAIRDLISDRIPGVIETRERGWMPGQGDGVGIFDIVYSSSYDDLTGEIYKAKDLPFDLDGVKSNRERLNIRITSNLP